MMMTMCTSMMTASKQQQQQQQQHGRFSSSSSSAPSSFSWIQKPRFQTDRSIQRRRISLANVCFFLMSVILIGGVFTTRTTRTSECSPCGCCSTGNTVVIGLVDAFTISQQQRRYDLHHRRHHPILSRRRKKTSQLFGMVVPPVLSIHSNLYGIEETVSRDNGILLLADATTTAAASATSSAEFEPILNVPALVSFLVIGIIFVWLQVRVSKIENAVEQRTIALEQLRYTKSQELDGTVSSQQVAQAVEQYRQAYQRVEALRTVIPGIARISTPSSSPLAERSVKENQAAAKQFLGIVENEDATTTPRNVQSSSSSTTTTSSSSGNNERSKRLVSNDDDNDDENTKRLPIPLAVLLGVIALSQITLLGFLMTDPMSSSSSSSSSDSLQLFSSNPSSVWMSPTTKTARTTTTTTTTTLPTATTSPVSDEVLYQTLDMIQTLSSGGGIE